MSEVRDIKFRAWDTISMQYFYDSILENGTEFMLCISGLMCFADMETYKQEDFILEQYTGLKDKNGKEIYEGDRLGASKYPDDDPCFYTVVFADGSYRKKYDGWDEGVSYPILNQGEINLLCDEIIGDIHESKPK